MPMMSTTTPGRRARSAKNDGGQGVGDLVPDDGVARLSENVTPSIKQMTDGRKKKKVKVGDGTTKWGKGRNQRGCWSQTPSRRLRKFAKYHVEKKKKGKITLK